MPRQINPNLKYLTKCYTEQRYEGDELVSGKAGVILEGSSRCFAKNQLVVTSEGSKKISEVQENDIVKSFNELTQKDEFKVVRDVHKYNNTKKSLRITLKNGSIIECTEDHKFFFEGTWVSIKHIVSLWHENINEY